MGDFGWDLFGYEGKGRELWGGPRPNSYPPKWEENVGLPFWIKLSLRIGLIFFFFLIFFLSSISSKLSPVQPNLIWLFVSFILDKIVPCETVFFLFFFFSLVCVHLLFFFFPFFLISI